MRHYLANLATIIIATALIAGAAVFAWVRSAQVLISDEVTVLARYEAVPEPQAGWRELGAQSYLSNCSNCHGRKGRGWDQYPGLGHTAQLFSAPGGRDYLIDVHLYGLTSDRWRAPMPPVGHIRDVEMAAVLNNVLTGFGNEQHLPADARLYSPQDIAARRGQGLSPWDVNRRRPDAAETRTQRGPL